MKKLRETTPNTFKLYFPQEFEKDILSLANPLDSKKKEVGLTTLKLIVSEKFKPKLFELFNALYLDKFGNELKQERKRDILKQIISRSASDFFGVEQKKADISTEWERCLKVTESKIPLTIFEYFDLLSQEIHQTFDLKLQGGWGAPEKDRILSFTLYTALVQSLFEQFVGEENLFKCTLRLNQAVRNHSVIFWDEIDKKDFNERLKKQWYAFRPLMYDNFLNQYFSSLGLLKCLNLELTDFTGAFFSESPIQNKKIQSEYPLEIYQLIAFYLNANMYKTFRSVNKTFYNALECNDGLRKSHRLHFLSSDYLLKELIGEVLFFDDKYLLTDPTNKHLSCNYCVTSMQKPYSIVSYGGKQGQWDRLLGGYVFEDSDKKINILTAYGAINFSIQLLKMDSLTPSTVTPVLKHVFVKLSDCSGKFRDEKVMISVNQEEVFVDVKCEREVCDADSSSISFFKPEKYHAKFNMVDFSDKSPVFINLVVKPS